MIASTTLPKLITFDGEARSGKGTIVSRVKDVLRDDHGYKVMLIDAGQVFRCLVVAATNRAVDLDSPQAIDAFLANDESAESCVQFVKAVYHMEKVDRDALLYSPEIGVASAKVGARPLSQEFKDRLLEKWLRDARTEGFSVVLLDGRALEEVGLRLASDGYCEYAMGLYFTCDPTVGAMRTLGFANRSFDSLNDSEKARVKELVEQIIERNRADQERPVQPIVPPRGAPIYQLPDLPALEPSEQRFMAVIDTTNNMTKDEMCNPVTELVVSRVNN